ncbi:ABC-2 type transport system ATP-binding protein [Actinomycetospora succinea]|uniref:ABC-2 type transport system ATP-binding protein n=1 Tax=Actinomycetospora succinea TaxID=663603 RepID=A0A4R6UV13_9PSEU|nr:ATP-binding cassette domain-containing protein [Actinomycetospora succinea]TDQ47334.1 ABC-2 type transport system ATP-binding protein [Actinomycetospora succinea]
MATEPAISVADLHHAYGTRPVLRGVDLDVAPGTVFALLGPNGAGKTTVVKILSTLVRADAGRLRVAGHDLATEPDAVRAAIGVTGQFSAVDGLLTGTENLQLMADLHHLPRARGRARTRELLEQFDLADAAGRPAGSYSGGMRRRLDLAMTLVGTPELIFLDEPTTGLDPRSRRDLWTTVRALVQTGVTVFLTTQYLEEADQLADDVGVLDGGRLVARGSPAHLKTLVPGGHVRARFAGHDDLAAAAGAVPAGVPDPDALTLQVPATGVPDLRALLDRLDAAGAAPDELTVHTPDLDDVFLALTGHATSTETTREVPAP